MSGVSGVSEGLANLVCLVHLGNLVSLVNKRLAVNPSISIEISQCLTIFTTLSGISGKISLEWYNECGCAAAADEAHSSQQLWVHLQPPP